MDAPGKADFDAFDEEYHAWYNKFEEKDGLKEGAFVRYIGMNEENEVGITYRHYCGFPADPRGLLTLNKAYEVEYRLLARSWQLVKLVGFPCNLEFSPSIFKVIDKNAEGKPLKVGGRLRYIGVEDRVLKPDNTYVVEGLLIHYGGYGSVGVKLLGTEGIFERSLFERVRE